jgi:hypothetical protein
MQQKKRTTPCRFNGVKAAWERRGNVAQELVCRALNTQTHELGKPQLVSSLEMLKLERIKFSTVDLNGAPL